MFNEFNVGFDRLNRYIKYIIHTCLGNLLKLVSNLPFWIKDLFFDLISLGFSYFNHILSIHIKLNKYYLRISEKLAIATAIVRKRLML